MPAEYQVEGVSWIAGEASREGSSTFTASNPRTGEAGPEFTEATQGEIEAAAAGAATAFGELRRWGTDAIAALLRGCADALEARSSELIAAADEETGLGETRLEGELARTTGQFRSFARMVNAGWHLEAMIDRGGDGRPDVRRVLQPLGPVAVFGASNFPLAFSVPGGDTAAALAAGCPVVAKGHPSHPATSELSARAISEAVRAAGAPPGTFSMVQGSSVEVGEMLVLADEMRAVAFTGSFAAGKSIYDLAATRQTPIPVFAEMGSLNPIFVTSRALDDRAEEIAEGLASSITLGVGQFCTKPGLVFIPAGSMDAFADLLAARLREVSAAPMLNSGVLNSFSAQFQKTASLDEVRVLLTPSTGDSRGLDCTPGLLSVTLDSFLQEPGLTEEHFGPLTVLVSTPEERMPEAAQHIEGSLTATIHADPGEAETLGALLDELRERAGRIVWNGFPTGVAVVPAMNHGGPYPATTNSQHTSVGMTAVRRFLRPVAFQDAPQDALPPALRDENPLGMRRLVDWEWE